MCFLVDLSWSQGAGCKGGVCTEAYMRQNKQIFVSGKGASAKRQTVWAVKVLPPPSGLTTTSCLGRGVEKIESNPRLVLFVVGMTSSPDY